MIPETIILYNREDVVRKIISSGDCDPNIEDLRGDTALMHAVYGDNPAAIRIMVNSAYTKNIIHVNKQNRCREFLMATGNTISSLSCLNLSNPGKYVLICNVDQKLIYRR